MVQPTCSRSVRMASGNIQAILQGNAGSSRLPLARERNLPPERPMGGGESTSLPRHPAWFLLPRRARLHAERRAGTAADADLARGGAAHSAPARAAAVLARIASRLGGGSVAPARRREQTGDR